MEAKTEIKTSYDILSEFCKIRNLNSSYYPSETETTPRMDYIIETLSEMGLDYDVDSYNIELIYEDHTINHDILKRISKDSMVYKYLQNEIRKHGKDANINLQLVKYMNESAKNFGRPTMDMVQLRKCLFVNRTTENGYYGNVIAKIPAKKETLESIMFTAHHDVNNVNSDNCADNSASVCNLLQLANELKGLELDKNIYIAFTDGEEFGGRGAEYLSERILKGDFGNVNHIINLEITGRGKNFWAEIQKGDSPLMNKLREFEKGRGNILAEYPVPFNDSIIFRSHGIDSVCIGIITDDDLIDVNTKGFCNTWELCHSDKDSFELVNKEDMKEFVEILHKLI